MAIETHPRIVVIGGVAAGASAAARARRTNEHAEITLFERGPYVSFANCGLPYFVGDTIQDRDELLLQTPDSLWKRFRIRVHVEHEVVGIDRVAKVVEVKRRSDGVTFTQPYDKLIVSPGASAIVPDVPGLPAPNVFTVKTVPDADRVRAWIEEHSPRRAVVVGAGFIGLETAEALLHRGLDVTVVELQPQVLPAFDPDVADFMARRVAEKGIHLELGDGLKSFVNDGRVVAVELASGRKLPADLVILSIGVRPELTLAKAAGLALGPSGAIAVDDHLRTSDPDIYAAGDAVEVVQLVTGKPGRMPLAGPANKQGRVAGANAAGGELVFAGALGTAIVGCVGLTAAKTGLSEREARQAGLAYSVTWTHPLDHAGYYPGAQTMHLKILVEQKSGRLLGAQAVGEAGVDKRIDVLATALHARMTVFDLEELDLAYAPQYSSAKDPVVMAAFAAANVLRGDVVTTTCSDMATRVERGEQIQVVDVRSPAEFATGHLPGAVNIPIDSLRERSHELDRSRSTVTYCKVGFRGYLGARILQQHGFERVENLTGGILSCPSSRLSERAARATVSG